MSDIHLNVRFFLKIEPIMKSTTHQGLMSWYLPLLGHVITKSLPQHTSLPSHWLPGFIDRFSCIFIGSQGLQLIINLLQLIIIPILQSHMLLNDKITWYTD